jgi:hypothetical protein
MPYIGNPLFELIKIKWPGLLMPYYAPLCVGLNFWMEIIMSLKEIQEHFDREHGALALQAAGKRINLISLVFGSL